MTWYITTNFLKILRYFPKFDFALKELSFLFERHQKTPKLLDFILKKIKIFIFLCPHYDIQQKALSFAEYYFKSFEEDTVSKFYPQEKIVSIYKLAKYFDEPIQKNLDPSIVLPDKIKIEEYRYLLSDLANFNGGKISHLERLLCWFPDYLNRYFQTKNFLMTLPGALPLDWRFFIGIMAVSCYGCEYLFNQLFHQFLIYGGEKAWILKGLDGVPDKLKKLGDLNSILAYKPWSIRSASSNHIKVFLNRNLVIFLKELLKGKDQWSIPELMHAMAILVYFHSWSCFVLANGVMLESDMDFFNEGGEKIKGEEKKEEKEANETSIFILR